MKLEKARELAGKMTDLMKDLCIPNEVIVEQFSKKEKNIRIICIIEMNENKIKKIKILLIDSIRNNICENKQIIMIGKEIKNKHERIIDIENSELENDIYKIWASIFNWNNIQEDKTLWN